MRFWEYLRGVGYLGYSTEGGIRLNDNTCLRKAFSPKDGNLKPAGRQVFEEGSKEITKQAWRVGNGATAKMGRNPSKQDCGTRYQSRHDFTTMRLALVCYCLTATPVFKTPFIYQDVPKDGESGQGAVSSSQKSPKIKKNI